MEKSTKQKMNKKPITTVANLILHKNTTLIAIVVLLILLIIEGFTGIPVHKSIVFFLSISVLMLILAFAVLKRMSGFSLKNTAFLLTHAGLFMVLLFGCLGSLQFQKLYVRTFHGVTENIAFDDDSSVYQLPFQITLKNFEAEFYDNHQPKSYKAEIMLKDGDTEKQVVLAVNHPVRFMGYDVYLSSYDRRNPNNPDFVLFITVYDPYVYAKYFGIIVLLMGLFLYICTLSFSKNRLVSLFIALFGLGFSYMVFSPYLFKVKNLVPALQSLWFVPHIAVYMFAYGALAVACLLSIYTICTRRGEKFFVPTELATYFSLKLGTCLMGIGLLFGALWAKIAWGNFWSFDLKETWAAIAWFAFLGVLHFKYAYKNRPKTLAILVIIAFLLLQMCWFGVNYLPEVLKSLHRY